ncbi:MAG TPA: flagellar hook-associated protein FlgK, partial [Phycisphaerae bacterium]|nr:flagellar hook-associated protein FlgK [Phycisphaerae bacterium]
MSLFGALSLGGSSLAAQQTGLQVTGNNIANAGTEGYTRQVARLTPGGAQKVGPGQFQGMGVTVEAIQRQVNDALNESLRNSTSDQAGAQTLNSFVSRIETTFGALNDNDLSARMNDFFNGFSTLATNPGDAAQRSVVVQNGASLADYLQSLRTQLFAIRTDAQAQIGTYVTQANSLCSTIASLNQQISTTEAGQGGANTLRDQRDQALSKLAEIMDIKVVDQGNGTVNVLVGSVPVVIDTTSRGISMQTVQDPSGQFYNTQLTFGDNGDTMNASGGKIGALLTSRDTYLTPAIQTVDQIASGLISAVNAIHSQGQGLSGFTTLTAANQVIDPTAALSAGKTITNLDFTPVNGTFNLYVTDSTTGQTTTKQIGVNLSGQGTQTTLNSLAASITAAGGGTVTATVNANGKLVISSSNQNVKFGFGEDTSGALASLGLNTFFTGKDASDIAVNNVLLTDPSMLAAGRNNVTGSNANAQAIALAGSAAVKLLNGKSLTDFYSDYIGDLSAHAKNISDDVTTQGAIHDTLFAQQQSISGVSMDEEAV